MDSWFQQSERVWEQAHQDLEQSAQITMKFADSQGKTPIYNPGLSTRDLRITEGCRKLAHWYISPFKIFNDVTYKL